MPETGRRGPPPAAHPYPLPGGRCRLAGRPAAGAPPLPASSQRLWGQAPARFTCTVSGAFPDSGAAEKLGFVSSANFHPVQKKGRPFPFIPFFSSVPSRRALIFFLNLQ